MLIKTVNTECEELEEIGIKNFIELKKYKWTNFSKYFLN